MSKERARLMVTNADPSRRVGTEDKPYLLYFSWLWPFNVTHVELHLLSLFKVIKGYNIIGMDECFA